MSTAVVEGHLSSSGSPQMPSANTAEVSARLWVVDLAGNRPIFEEFGRLPASAAVGLLGRFRGGEAALVSLLSGARGRDALWQVSRRRSRRWEMRSGRRRSFVHLLRTFWIP